VLRLAVLKVMGLSFRSGEGYLEELSLVNCLSDHVAEFHIGTTVFIDNDSSCISFDQVQVVDFVPFSTPTVCPFTSTYLSDAEDDIVKTLAQLFL
jgi:hypothetical protein